MRLLCRCNKRHADAAPPKGSKYSILEYLGFGNEDYVTRAAETHNWDNNWTLRVTLIPAKLLEAPVSVLSSSL